MAECIWHRPSQSENKVTPVIRSGIGQLSKLVESECKNSNDPGHTCLVPDLSGKGLSFSSVSLMLVLGFLCRCSSTSLISPLFLVC